jgi:3-phosphoshikimate 1-carboxyvinyltransferase
MRIRIEPGGRIQGTTSVPGDKSISHRWLILAATAEGRSRLRGLPASLDVSSTAECLAQVVTIARPSLEAWSHNLSPQTEGNGSTWNHGLRGRVDLDLEVEGHGRSGLVAPDGELYCGNSGTTMRLLCGVLAATGFSAVLTGDESLSRRPMDRVAEPLRQMGAAVDTTQGRPPVKVRGADLRGIEFQARVPSAQVKSAVLLAGQCAQGETVVRETAPTRDHTERALIALGGSIEAVPGEVRLRPFQHGGFEGTIPGDPSSAAFLIAGAALTDSDLTIEDVGLNPSRLHFLNVMRRMGLTADLSVQGHQVGEPVGELRVAQGTDLRSVEVDSDELPLVIDEVPILALMAAHAPTASTFRGAGELRGKESDRLESIAKAIRALGGGAEVQGNDLMVAGGGLAGGSVESAGDHRMAMALAIGALASRAPVSIEGMQTADVSFPGFVRVLRELGADVEVV